MGWIRELLSPSEGGFDDVAQQREERFPSHTYGPGYPIVIHRQELEDLNRLLEIERDAPDIWDSTPLLSREEFDEIVEDVTGEFGGDRLTRDDRRDELYEILGLWEEQLNGSEDAVWVTVGTDFRFEIYITQCEVRAEQEEDQFEEPGELDTAREILDRIQTAQDTDSKLAVMHKRHLPLQEPEEEESDAS